ncbi:hypothetical protein BU15DRAFT_67000 [Melanogaster broomeanus]|nr:hypothetical protein BU15DRAFT_67000 [Melanogaster broomeanus]
MARFTGWSSDDGTYLAIHTVRIYGITCFHCHRQFQSIATREPKVDEQGDSGHIGARESITNVVPQHVANASCTLRSNRVLWLQSVAFIAPFVPPCPVPNSCFTHGAENGASSRKHRCQGYPFGRHRLYCWGTHYARPIKWDDVPSSIWNHWGNRVLGRSSRKWGEGGRTVLGLSSYCRCKAGEKLSQIPHTSVIVMSVHPQAAPHLEVNATFEPEATERDAHTSGSNGTC